MLKKVFAGAVAVVFAAGVAAAANLTLLSGPQDPSQLLATINQLIRSINSGVAGRLSAQVLAVGNTTTIEQTLQTYSLPANQLAAPGDAVRVVCWGFTKANADTKTAKLYFGSSNSSSQVVELSPNNKSWKMTLMVIRDTTTAQLAWGDVVMDSTPVAVYRAAPTETLTSAVTIRCTGTATATGDITASGMYIEQIK